jgi:LEA14-like dessication related protein
MTRRSPFAALLAAAALSACAGMLPGSDPLKVTLAGIEPLPGEGMELRLAVKLRVLNPNDRPIDFDGVALDLELRGDDLASGVSDARGSVPRYGETVVTVPLTVSAFAVARQAYGLYTSDDRTLDFVARGKLGGGAFGAVRFESRGRFDLPAGLGGPMPTGTRP